mmetsp:Transcript_12081/g.23310  ORF Transcript_12081/g.23310 Transcript_12081/m.23310 type:complete len:137 (-) Transcript_12081:1085-1495(-)
MKQENQSYLFRQGTAFITPTSQNFFSRQQFCQPRDLEDDTAKSVSTAGYVRLFDCLDVSFCVAVPCLHRRNRFPSSIQRPKRERGVFFLTSFLPFSKRGQSTSPTSKCKKTCLQKSLLGRRLLNTTNSWLLLALAD